MVVTVVNLRHYIAPDLLCVFVIDELCLRFKVKASVANGHLPNMQDASVVKMSPDASKPDNVSLPERQQKSQVWHL